MAIFNVESFLDSTLLPSVITRKVHGVLGSQGSREHGAKKAREQGAWKQKNNKNSGSIENFAREQAKNNLGSREPRGYF